MTILSKNDERVPIVLLTGYLGSGKTTLLSKLLHHPYLGRTAVLVNEFGEVPLDQVLLGDATEHMITLAGGCLCCVAVRDVTAALVELHQRHLQTPFERVIVETSGLADPGPVLALLQSEDLLPRYRLEGVVTVVDALQGERELGRQPVCVRQVTFADYLVVTKTDISAPRAVERLLGLLGELNPWAGRAKVVRGALDPALLFNGSIPVPRALELGQEELQNVGHVHDHDEDDDDHEEGVHSFCLRFAEPLDWEELYQGLERLQAAVGERLLRFKGLLWLQGHPRPVVLHGVAGHVHPLQELENWPDQDPISRIVFIVDDVEQAVVEANLGLNVSVR
jgi:G3E family GTPase